MCVHIHMYAFARACGFCRIVCNIINILVMYTCRTAFVFIVHFRIHVTARLHVCRHVHTHVTCTNVCKPCVELSFIFKGSTFARKYILGSKPSSNQHEELRYDSKYWDARRSRTLTKRLSALFSSFGCFGEGRRGSLM